MKKKEVESYKKILNILNSKQENLCPKNILVDFEASSYAAFKEIYPSTKIFGCIFHLGQILWRRVQHYGMTNFFKNSFENMMHLKMILCMSFIPVEKKRSI
jgi:hypothetical protein